MSYQYPADGRVMVSQDDDRVVVGLPPLPCEPVACSGRLDAFHERLDAMSDDVLDKATIELRSTINVANARFALQVGEMERRNIARLDHGLTMTGWLKKHCQMTAVEASGTIKTARAMAQMPSVTNNALGGSVPPRSVQLLGQARDRYKSEFVDHEEVFGDIATYLSVKDLRKAIGHWEQQVSFVDARDRASHREGLNSLYLAEMLDGMGDIKGSLSPEIFHTLRTVIDTKVNPTFLDRDDRRTPAQRRADALGDICAFYLTHNDNRSTSPTMTTLSPQAVRNPTSRSLSTTRPSKDTSNGCQRSGAHPCHLKHCDVSPVTQASSPCSSDQTQNHWMWAERHAPSPPHYAGPLNNETRAVHGKDAVHPCHGATHTTSSTGQTEEKPTSPTPNSSAAHTTPQPTNKNDHHPIRDAFLRFFLIPDTGQR